MTTRAWSGRRYGYLSRSAATPRGEGVRYCIEMVFSYGFRYPRPYPRIFVTADLTSYAAPAQKKSFRGPLVHSRATEMMQC